MCAEKPPEKRFIAPSLNETERKMEVDRINFENSLLKSRLEKTGTYFNLEKMEEDFKRHQEAGKLLRRRQLRPIGSPSSKKEIPGSMASTFDAQSYIGMHASSGMLAGNGAESINGNSIRSVSDFRRQVLTNKRAPNLEMS